MIFCLQLHHVLPPRHAISQLVLYTSSKALVFLEWHIWLGEAFFYYAVVIERNRFCKKWVSGGNVFTSVGLSVCLHVNKTTRYSTQCGPIFVKLGGRMRHGLETNRLDFWTDPALNMDSVVHECSWMFNGAHAYNYKSFPIKSATHF